VHISVHSAIAHEIAAAVILFYCRHLYMRNKCCNFIDNDTAVPPLVYSQSQGLPSRQCLYLEQFAGGCDLRSITAGVQTTPEDSSVQPQLSEHMCYLNFVFLL